MGGKRDGTRPVYLSWRVTVDRSVALRQSIQLRGVAGDVGRGTKGSSARSLFFNRGYPFLPQFPPFGLRLPAEAFVAVDEKETTASRKRFNNISKFQANYNHFTQQLFVYIYIYFVFSFFSFIRTFYRCIFIFYYYVVLVLKY